MWGRFVGRTRARGSRWSSAFAGLFGAALTAAILASGSASAQPFDTVTSLASSRNPADAGQTVAFTVRVQSNGLNPIGTIDLSDQSGSVASGFVPPTGIAGSVIAAGQDHSCAVTSAGGAMCWGYNGNGALGTGNNTGSLVPVAVSNLSSGVSSIVATAGATCALTTAGGVKCWGGGYIGGSSTSPADMSGLTSGIAAIAGRGSHACALTTAGGVRCWGYNGDGQLGNGSTTDSTTPVDVQGLTSGVVAIATGDYHSCAVTDAGAVKCWGRNTNGQLGNGSYSRSTTPADVSGLSSGYKWVSAGYGHSCALSESGAVKCWGLNSAGQLGTGSTSPSTVETPVAVSGLSSGVAALVSGANHSCVLEPTNKMMCWGSNGSAQLGDGTTTTRSSPTAVPSFSQSTVSSIVAGNYHTCAELYDGTMKCWGYNGSGQMGDGTVAGFMSPQSTAISTVSSLTAMTEGRAVLSVSTLGAGIRSLVASFAAGGPFNGSSSSTLAQTINGPANATTTTALATSDATTVYGENVTFTATVTSSGATPTGQVQFHFDGEAVGAIDLDGDGKATLNRANLDVGDHTIGATYLGATGFDGSRSAAVNQTVGQASTTTSLAMKNNPVPVGTQVVVAISVLPVSPAAGEPTGTVKIYEGSNLRGSATLNGGGRGAADLGALPAGIHTLRGNYLGDDNFTASQSTYFTVTVTGGTATSTTTTIVAGASKILPGAAVKFTAAVTAAAPPDAAEMSAAPTGSVVFKDGATVLGTAALSGGRASLTTRALTTGAHSIVASYKGTTEFAASSSTGVAVSVDPRVGPEFRVNSHTAGSQLAPSVAAQTGGGFVTAWASQDQDGSSWGVYAQRYKTDGSRSGGEFLVNTTTETAQSDPAVAATTDGGFTVAWVGRVSSLVEKGYELRAQRWSASGGKLGSEFRINDALALQISAPALTSDGAGGFATAWMAKRGTMNNYHVFARLHDEKGQAASAEVPVASIPSAVFTKAPTITRIKGGYVVLWAHAAKAGANPVIKGQRLSATGARVGSEFAVTSANFTQSQPVVAATADGGFVVAWASAGQDGTGRGVHAQRYTATGARAGSAFRVNTTTRYGQFEPSVAAGSAGGFIVVWTSDGQDGSKAGVYAQRFDVGGNPVDVEFRINTTVKDAQNQPSVAFRTATDFVVTWTSMGQDGDAEGVYGQRFSVAP